jgi:hypothetical protein
MHFGTIDWGRHNAFIPGSAVGAHCPRAMVLSVISFARWGALAALAIGLGGVPARAEGKDCFKTWDEARDAIQANGLVSGKEITQRAADPANVPADSSFLEAYLCQESGGFVYKLYYLDEDSQVVIRTVDARRPFPAQ